MWVSVALLATLALITTGSKSFAQGLDQQWRNENPDKITKAKDRKDCLAAFHYAHYQAINTKLTRYFVAKNIVATVKIYENMLNGDLMCDTYVDPRFWNGLNKQTSRNGWTNLLKIEDNELVQYQRAGDASSPVERIVLGRKRRDRLGD